MKRSLVCLLAIVGSVCVAGSARAQVGGEATITVSPPPPGQVPSQPSYGVPQSPPPGYGQPYVQPQTYYAPVLQPASPQYVERSESIKPLWITGVILLPTTWVLTWITASATTYCEAGPCRDIDYWLWSWVPLVGPWFMIGHGDDERALNAGEIAGAVFSGVAQTAGLMMIILGLALRQTVRVQTFALDDSERAPALSLGLAPALGGAELTATLTHF